MDKLFVGSPRRLPPGKRIESPVLCRRRARHRASVLPRLGLGLEAPAAAAFVPRLALRLVTGQTLTRSRSRARARGGMSLRSRWGRRLGM